MPQVNQELGPGVRAQRDALSFLRHLDAVEVAPVVPSLSARTPPPKGSKVLYVTTATMNRIRRVCSLPYVTTYSLKGATTLITTKNSLNTDAEHIIHNDAVGTFWVSGSNTKVKLGKIITQLCPKMTPLAIEQAVTAWKTAYQADTSTVEVSEDISFVYDISSVGNSCMAHHGSWMALYEELGCKVVFIRDYETLELKARAILWYQNVYINDNPEQIITIMDRVFFKTESDKITLNKWCAEQGYHRGFRELPNVKTCETLTDGYEGVPYIDVMCQLIDSEIGGQYQLSNGYGVVVDTLQSTSGHSERACGISTLSGIWCVDTESEHPEDDVYYCETDGEYYSTDNDLFYINDEYYHYEDENIVSAEDEGWCFLEDCVQAYDTEDYYMYLENLLYCDDIDEYITESGDSTYIEDLEERHYNFDGYEADDGSCWSSEEAFYIENPKEKEAHNG